MSVKSDTTTITYTENVSLFHIEEVLIQVITAMKEKNYDPVNQLIGYLMTGEPTYITSHNQARVNIQKIDRDLLLQVIVEDFIESKLTNKEK